MMARLSHPRLSEIELAVKMQCTRGKTKDPVNLYYSLTLNIEP